ncbi:hypothetical protein Ddye_015441 [Dipteronia dyeriana]|uniref:Reverse transcriptase domain-containing protein n=1 Tax=Dipteronia dyeriana TaxID=168575 RepID=A0AAD9U5A1_9ROSI|nr:hypothetical protein Ddye_015441 [Dipteronia dyeriana]
MMSKLCFSDSWIDRIIRCIKSVSYSFIVNGEIRGNLIPSWGLQHLLSPYLFLICVEDLSRLVFQAEKNGDISGFKCSKSGLNISHIFFAYDKLLFTRASNRDSQAIRKILEDYAKASGQVINFHKSGMCIGLGVSNHCAETLARIIGVNLVDYHEKYLGLPSFAGRNKKQNFDNIKDRVWCILRGWQNKLFSVWGKEVLLKAVIRSIPTYSMSLFKLPRTLIQDLHRLSARF